MPDILVAEVGLDRAGIDAIVGQLEAAGVPEHVGVDGETAFPGGRPPSRPRKSTPRRGVAPVRWSISLPLVHHGPG